MTYSINTFTVTGGQATYNISFSGASPGYLDEDHVRYYIGEDDQGLQARTLPTSTTVTINPVPADGTEISFRRKTSPEAPLVDWLSGEAVTEEALDRSNLQMLYLAQESADAGGAAALVYSSAAISAAGAATEAAGLATAAAETATNAVSSMADMYNRNWII